eukprot:4172245-Alexandrium_andersonii.AAC.1
MSASLVGSEMCIRDRTNPSRQGFVLSEGAPEHRGAGNAQLIATTRGTTPVSYTHLTLPTICSV